MVLGGNILCAVLGVILRNDIRIPIKQAVFQWKVIRFFWFSWLTCGLGQKKCGSWNGDFKLSIVDYFKMYPPEHEHIFAPLFAPKIKDILRKNGDHFWIDV